MLVQEVAPRLPAIETARMSKILVTEPSDTQELRRLLEGFPPHFRDAARALYVRGYREGMKDRKQPEDRELL